MRNPILENMEKTIRKALGLPVTVENIDFATVKTQKEVEQPKTEKLDEGK